MWSQWYGLASGAKWAGLNFSETADLQCLSCRINTEWCKETENVPFCGSEMPRWWVRVQRRMAWQVRDEVDTNVWCAEKLLGRPEGYRKSNSRSAPAVSGKITLEWPAQWKLRRIGFSSRRLLRVFNTVSWEQEWNWAAEDGGGGHGLELN